MVNLDPAARPTFAVVLEALRASPSCPPSYSGKFSPVLALQPLAGASSALQQAPGVTAAAAQAAAAIDGGVAPRALPQQAGVGLELQPNHEGGGLVVTGIVQGSAQCELDCFDCAQWKVRCVRICRNNADGPHDGASGC
jgi:hypothetical protein